MCTLVSVYVKTRLRRFTYNNTQMYTIERNVGVGAFYTLTNSLRNLCNYLIYSNIKRKQSNQK